MAVGVMKPTLVSDGGGNMSGNALALIVPLSHGDPDVSIKALKPGDTLVIKNINGLEDNGVAMPAGVEQAEPIEVSLYHADVSGVSQPPSRYQMGMAVADAVQQILVQMEQVEIQERKAVQAKAIKEAKAKGIRFGRPTATMPENFGEIVKQWESGELSLQDALEQTGLKHTTFYGRVREYRSSQ